ncbi:MAG: hypothetical protein AB9869_08150 [Verrucomicrobiia bacterium]
MQPDDDDFLPTHQSLLSRLRSWRNEESGQEFFDTYSRLIYRMAVKTGLSDAEAQDVVQEILQELASVAHPAADREAVEEAVARDRKGIVRFRQKGRPDC